MSEDRVAPRTARIEIDFNNIDRSGNVRLVPEVWARDGNEEVRVLALMVDWTTQRQAEAASLDSDELRKAVENPTEPRTEAGRRLIAAFPANAADASSPAFIRHMAQSILATEEEAAVLPSEAAFAAALQDHETSGIHGPLHCSLACGTTVRALLSAGDKADPYSFEGTLARISKGPSAGDKAVAMTSEYIRKADAEWTQSRAYAQRMQPDEGRQPPTNDVGQRLTFDGDPLRPCVSCGWSVYAHECPSGDKAEAPPLDAGGVPT